jgi:hypothetical protein
MVTPTIEDERNTWTPTAELLSLDEDTMRTAQEEITGSLERLIRSHQYPALYPWTGLSRLSTDELCSVSE